MFSVSSPRGGTGRGLEKQGMDDSMDVFLEMSCEYWEFFEVDRCIEYRVSPKQTVDDMLSVRV